MHAAKIPHKVQTCIKINLKGLFPNLMVLSLQKGKGILAYKFGNEIGNFVQKLGIPVACT